MKAHRVLSVLAAALLAVGGSRAEDAPADSKWKGLEVGTRILHVVLDEDKRGGALKPLSDPSKPTSYAGRFLGTINELEVEQDYLPLRLYLQYFVNDYFGIGLSYDRLEVDTRDELKSDGILTMDGPILYAVGRKTGETYTPFAELGVGLYGTSYDPDPAWEDAGPRGRRVMDIDDPVAFVLGLGCDVAISGQCALNLYARAVLNATADAKAYYSKDPTKTPFAEGEFPLDYYGFGIGVKYAFR